jgi:hypothetical protein
MADMAGLEQQVLAEMRFGGSEETARADLVAAGVDEPTIAAILERVKAKIAQEQRKAPRAIKPPPRGPSFVAPFFGGLALIVVSVALSLISIPALSHSGGGVFVLYGPILIGVGLIVRAFLTLVR